MQQLATHLPACCQGRICQPVVKLSLLQQRGLRQGHGFQEECVVVGHLLELLEAASHREMPACTQFHVVHVGVH